MTVPAFRSAANADIFDDQVTVNKPAGTADDDIMIFEGYAEPDGLDSDPPSGWNVLVPRYDNPNGFSVSYFWKRASSEGSDYFWECPSATFIGGYIYSYSDASVVGNPFKVGTIFGNSFTAPDDNPQVNNFFYTLVDSLVCANVVNFAGETVSAGVSGMATRVNTAGHYLGTYEPAAPGSATAMEVTLTGSTHWSTFVFQLRSVDDVPIYEDVPSGYDIGSDSRIIWIDSLTGYCFYNHNFGYTQGGTIYYKKTIDGGITWAAEVRFLRTGGNDDAIGFFGIWYDRETPGDTGTLIHLAASNWQDNSSWYRNLDTSSDTLGTAVEIAANSAGDSYDPYNYNNQQMSITKSRGGNLYVWMQSFWSYSIFARSTDGGANWVNKSTPGEGTGNDRAQLIPAGDTDANDIACLYYDNDAFELTFKLYDDSGDSWGNETYIGGMDRFSGGEIGNYWSMAVAINPADNKAWVCWWFNQFGNFATNLYTAILTLTVAGADVELTADVLTSASEAQECCIMIDANNPGTAYVAYIGGGTWLDEEDVYYKKTTDSMATWDSAIQLNETTLDHRRVYCQTVIQAGQKGRFEPVWIEDNGHGIICNPGLSVEIDTSFPYRRLSAYDDGDANSVAVALVGTPVDGELILFIVGWNESPTFSTPAISGFSIIASNTDSDYNPHYIFGKIASSEGTNPTYTCTFTGGTKDGASAGAVLVIENASSILPTNVTDVFDVTDDSNHDIPAITIAQEGSLDLVSVLNDGNSSGAAGLYVDWPQSLIEIFDIGAAPGYVRLGIAAATRTVTGSQSATSVTQNAHAFSTAIRIEIEPFTDAGEMTATGAVTLSSLRAKGYGPRQAIRPSGTDTAGSWTAVGAASLHAATNDDSNASYDELADGDDPSTMILEMQTLSTPDVGDGAVVVRLQAYINTLGIDLIVNGHAEALADIESDPVDTTGANFIVIHQTSQNGDPYTITDNKSNTWYPLSPANGGSTTGKLFYAYNAIVGTGHIFYGTGGSVGNICFAAFSNVLASGDPFDDEDGQQGHWGPGFASMPATAPTGITPSENGELIISGVTNSDTIEWTVDSGMIITDFVDLGPGDHYAGALAYKVQSVAAAINPGWDSDDHEGTVVLASFKAM